MFSRKRIHTKSGRQTIGVYSHGKDWLYDGMLAQAVPYIVTHGPLSQASRSPWLACLSAACMSPYVSLCQQRVLRLFHQLYAAGRRHLLEGTSKLHITIAVTHSVDKNIQMKTDITRSIGRRTSIDSHFTERRERKASVHLPERISCPMFL